MQDSRDASHCLNTIQVAQVRMVCTQGKLKASFCCLHISEFDQTWLDFVSCPWQGIHQACAYLQHRKLEDL